MSAASRPVYLNNSATSHPKPEEVLACVRDFLAAPHVGAGRGHGVGAGEDVTTASRRLLARLFGVDDPRTISFTPGATFSMNMVIAGLGIDGGHVVTTALEHTSVLRPLKRLERTRGVEVTIVPCDERGRVDAAAVERALRPDTRAVFVSHASNVVSSVTDVARIGDVTAAEGITLVVDASQSAGCVPIDVRRMGIDVLVFTGHKFLFGLEGSGGVYIREGLHVEPLLLGGTGVKSGSLYQSEDRPACYEAGTQNLLGIAALGAGVSYVLRNGLERLGARRRELFARLVDGLDARPDVVRYGERRYETPIVSFNVRGLSPRGVGRALWEEHGVHVRSGLLCAPLVHERLGTSPEGAVRVSFSELTTDADVNRFFEALDAVRDGARQDAQSGPGGALSCY